MFYHVGGHVCTVVILDIYFAVCIFFFVWSEGNSSLVLASVIIGTEYQQGREIVKGVLLIAFFGFVGFKLGQLHDYKANMIKHTYQSYSPKS